MLTHMERNILQKLLGKGRDGLKLSFKKETQGSTLNLLFFFPGNMFFSRKDFVILLEVTFYKQD